MERNELKDWAKQEIELARKATNNDPELEPYYEAVYNSYINFIGQTIDLDKGGFVKMLLIKLLEGDPLTEIKGEDDEWVLAEDLCVKDEVMNYDVYYSKRRPTLFKKIIKERDGKTKVLYTDTNRATCIDINTKKMFVGGFGVVVLDEVMPITMPYHPDGKIKIFTEEFKHNDECESNFDTFAVLYFRMPSGYMKKVGRYFKENPETKMVEEIEEAEYNERRKAALQSKYTEKPEE